ncbi:MAG TPA: DUF3298 domain-containing protein [Candidatus Paceibacterota bacterium]
MVIEWNKVTWYSKLLAVILFVLVFYIGFNLGEKKKEVISPPTKTEEQKVPPVPVTIKTKDIKEENFSGKVPVISGSGKLSLASQEYINQTVADFKKEADEQVPSMREQFGEESPTAQYEIDINAKYIEGGKTESVVMRVYTYTGGAHGNSSYKVITASAPAGGILSLADVVQTDKRAAFVEFVKKELKIWKSDEAGLFPEAVDALNFGSFADWAFDKNNLILFFDQYEIGAGVLGPVDFPIKIERINDFLNFTVL